MSTDGRATRWAQHREDRRRELVSATLRAIRVHGASVALDEIAARAGTSKTVIYRHFGDRAGLYEAVVDAVHAYIHAGLMDTVTRGPRAGLHTFVTDLTDAYLALVERDVEIYRFVMTPPASSGGGDPAGDLPRIIGTQVGEALARHGGIDAARARIWGTGLMGCIRATADLWMTQQPRPPRADVVEAVSALLTPGLVALEHPTGHAAPPAVTASAFAPQ